MSYIRYHFLESQPLDQIVLPDKKRWDLGKSDHFAGTSCAPKYFDLFVRAERSVQ